MRLTLYVYTEYAKVNHVIDTPTIRQAHNCTELTVTDNHHNPQACNNDVVHIIMQREQLSLKYIGECKIRLAHRNNFHHALVITALEGNFSTIRPL